METQYDGIMLLSTPNLLVLSNASLVYLKPSALSNQALTSAAMQAEGRRTTGPRVIPSART